MKVSKESLALFKAQMDKEFRNGYAMLNDQYTIMLIMGMLYMSRQKRRETAKLLYTFIALKFYSSLVHISFPKFCSDELWKLTLTKVSPKHLFREKNGVPNALLHIIEMLYKRYEPVLSGKEIREKDLVRVIYDLRHRLSQSLKSFAEAYYDLQKKGGFLKTSGEEDENADVQLISDKISMSICTFGQVDDVALNIAIAKSGINRDIGTSTILEISSVNYKDRMRFILILMGRTGNIKLLCTESGRNSFVRKMETGLKIGKYSAREEILSMLYSTELGYRLKSIYTTQLVVFFSHYMAFYIKGKIC
jgi:predicted secreted protein